MSRLAILTSLVLTMTAAGMAATVDWQGGSTSLNDPTKWYVVTTNDPTSTTGETRLPYRGTGASFDAAWLRNGVTATLDATINANNFYLASPIYTGGPLTTTMNVVSGGVLNLGDQFYVGYGNNSTGVVNQTGGLVSQDYITTNNFRVGQASTSGTTRARGEYNLSGGTVRIASANGELRCYVGYFGGGTGVFNQSGDSLVEVDTGGVSTFDIAWGKNNTPSMNMCQGTYNLSGGTLRLNQRPETLNPCLYVARDHSQAWFNQSGGVVDWWTVGVGYCSPQGKGWEYFSEGWYTMTGGTLKVEGQLNIGRTYADTSIPPVYTNASTGHFALSQDAVIDAVGSLAFAGAGACTFDLTIASAADFDATFDGSMWGSPELTVTFDSYTPTIGQEWKLIQQGANNLGLMAVDWSDVPAGFRVDKDEALYAYVLVYEGLGHPGDANNDGYVDVGDLGILAFNWSQSPRTWAQGNFTTPDTVVDVGDLGVLAFNWGWIGSPTGAGNVPEPASLTLLALGSLLAIRRRR